MTGPRELLNLPKRQEPRRNTTSSAHVEEGDGGAHTPGTTPEKSLRATTCREAIWRHCHPRAGQDLHYVAFPGIGDEEPLTPGKVSAAFL